MAFNFYIHMYTFVTYRLSLLSIEVFSLSIETINLANLTHTEYQH